jgi:hypothetical protein
MKPMNHDQLLAESFGLLSRVLEEAYLLITIDDLREAFAYRHARNISQLGQDVLLLESHSQPDSCPIIVRAMLEGLFKLVAATKAPDAAVGIVLSEIKEEIGLIQKWIKAVGDNCADLSESIQRLSSFSDSLRMQHNVGSSKDWNAFECARIADLGTVYRQYYFLFSKHTHATAGGIIAQEKEIARDCVLKAVVFVILCTVGNLVQVVETKTPQLHVDEATKLMEAALTFANLEKTES